MDLRFDELKAEVHWDGERDREEEDVKLGEVLFDFEASKVITIQNLMRSKDKDLYAQMRNTRWKSLDEWDCLRIFASMKSRLIFCLI